MNNDSTLSICCSSRQYGAPAPNRVGNGVRTRPHAPFEDRRVRSVSATRPGRSHALPRARGGPTHPHVPRRGGHAPRGATMHVPRAEGSCPRAARSEEGQHTRRTRARATRRKETSEGDYSGETYERVPEFGHQLTSVDLQFDDEMQTLLFLSPCQSWETLVVSLSNSAPNGKLTTSMVMDALFNEEARRREMGSTDQNSAYLHLCRDERCSLHMQHAMDVYGWRTTQLAELLAEDSKGCSLTLVEEFSEFLRKTRRCCGKEDWRAIPIGGECPDRRSTVRHGPVVLVERMDKGSNRCTEYAKQAQGSSEKGDQVDFEKLYSEGAVTPKQVSFALDLINGSVLSVLRTREERWSHDNSQSDVLAAHRWGVWGTPVGGAGHLGEKGAGILLMGELDQKLSGGQLEDIRLPSSGLEGEIVESSQSG
ncbi:hypothetical protein Acr_15g0013840 [Actinidia rufa]|uniref:Uncharacterized protein n=1 Tax=Actinidia rufa TaxID=165716 RepID=A0A7J0FVS0_9ERIC|nr:hypothetical protein Acr_15g0013840 [Actinidia rufa]